MSTVRFPVERTVFKIVEKKEYGLYVLLSKKLTRHKMSLVFFNIEEPEIGDLIELTNSMLIMDAGMPLFSNRSLYFGQPNENAVFPKGFNVEEDYAYLTYRKKNIRLLIQRCYG